MLFNFIELPTRTLIFQEFDKLIEKMCKVDPDSIWLFLVQSAEISFHPPKDLLEFGCVPILPEKMLKYDFIQSKWGTNVKRNANFLFQKYFERGYF
ncbi:hypothetical protein M0812_28360 [Anaeramoeba flamelloides]|uniref:Uncharacterized protein n=1 Tax=Anaeramoeba flamelloides TaxID=1746091 RepID=A0AAV7YBB4_9EUKA|nr:hypothetical protein M0812_28360 [Anaeramoeba flamelloides]